MSKDLIPSKKGPKSFVHGHSSVPGSKSKPEAPLTFSGPSTIVQGTIVDKWRATLDDATGEMCFEVRKWFTTHNGKQIGVYDLWVVDENGRNHANITNPSLSLETLRREYKRPPIQHKAPPPSGHATGSSNKNKSK